MHITHIIMYQSWEWSSAVLSTVYHSKEFLIFSSSNPYPDSNLLFIQIGAGTWTYVSHNPSCVGFLVGIVSC